MRFGTHLALVLAVLLLAGIAGATTSNLTGSVSVTQPNANIIVTGFASSANQVTAGSSMTFTTTLQNNGFYSTTGDITLLLQTTGPSPISSVQTINGLNPWPANEVDVITLGNAAETAGSYTANIVGNFLDQNNVLRHTNVQSLTYTVVSPSGGGGGGGGGGGSGGGGAPPVPSYPRIPPSLYIFNVSSTLSESIEYASSTVKIVVSTNSTTPVPVISEIDNVTYYAPGLPVGLKMLSATDVNLTASETLLLNLTLQYPCSAPASAVAPYKLISNTWTLITPYHVNPSACNINFLLNSNDPTVAVIENESLLTAPIVQIPQLYITYIPLFITLLRGTTTLSNIGLQNTGVGTESITLSVPHSFSNMLSISAGSLVLQPGQTINVNLLFSAPPNVTLGTYVIPLNISTTSNGKTVNQTEYISSTIYAKNATQPYMVNQINVINNTQVATGIIQISAPDNANLTGVYMQTVLPPGIVSNISQITAFGLQASVLERNSTFIINWYIPFVPRGTSVYGYYNINRPSRQQLLKYAQTAFVAPSAVSAEQILRVTNVQLPTFYQNVPDNVSLQILYTDAQPAAMTVSLSGPPDTNVTPLVQTLNVTPNQLVQVNFSVAASHTGTKLLNLRINSGNNTVTQTFPVIVLQQGALSGLNLFGGQQGTTTLALTILFIIVAVFIISRLAPSLRKQTGAPPGSGSISEIGKSVGRIEDRVEKEIEGLAKPGREDRAKKGRENAAGYLSKIKDALAGGEERHVEKETKHESRKEESLPDRREDLKRIRDKLGGEK